MASPENSNGHTDNESEREFMKRMTTTVLNGFCLVGISLGKKLRLFDVMAENDKPLTSAEIADKAACKERYVREWLYHMVMCDIVEVDQTGNKFFLPPERQRVLTEQPNLINRYVTYFQLMSSLYDEIVECFQKDGPRGLSFERTCSTFKTILNISGHVDMLKKNANFLVARTPDMAEKLESGIQVCDIGCGNGTILFHLASQFPKSRFVGVDLSSDLLKVCIDQKSITGISNVEFILQDVADLPDSLKNKFDWVFTHDVLHDLPHVNKALKSIAACLRPDGIFSVIEVGMSSDLHTTYRKQKTTGQILYLVSIFHCLASSLYYSESDGLGCAVGVEKMSEMIQEAGFEPVKEPEMIDKSDVLMIFKRATETGRK